MRNLWFRIRRRTEVRWMDSVISIGLIVIVAVVFIGAVIMEKKRNKEKR